MVVALAFVATAVSSLFAQVDARALHRDHRPQDGAWALALGMFALASVALATGTATGWDNGTFRVFYLFGAVLDVPWLALGTVYLLASRDDRPARPPGSVLVLSGFAAGVLVIAPMDTVHGTAIPVGKDVFGVLPRVLAAVGSGVAAIVIVGGAVYSAVPVRPRPQGARACPPGGSERAHRARDPRALERRPDPGRRRPRRGVRVSLAVGITVIYAGFLLAATRGSEARVLQATSG